MSTMLTTLTENLAKSLEIQASSQKELMDTLKATAFKSDKPITDAQMTAVMIVAQQYNLNPWTREIYAYPDKGGITPVVGVDGWARIINNHPQLDGIEFVYSEEKTEHKKKVVHEWIECVITRKDRNKPIVVREYFDEVCRYTSFATPWDTHPKRMHRHKAMIQCARVAFGFGGIYDNDEAEEIPQEKIINPIANSAAVDFTPFEELMKQIPAMDIDGIMSIKSEPYTQEERELLRKARSARKREIESSRVVANITPIAVEEQIKSCKDQAGLDAILSELNAAKIEELSELINETQAGFLFGE